MTFRLPRLAAAVVALTMLAATSCGGADVASIDVSLRLSQGCVTPDLAVGSEIWATDAAMPPTWTGDAGVVEP